MNRVKSLTVSLFSILLLHSSIVLAGQPNVTNTQPTTQSAEPSLLSKGFDLATLLTQGYSFAGKSVSGMLPAALVISKLRPNLNEYPLLQMLIPTHAPKISDPAYEKFISLTNLLITINKDKILPMIPELFKKYVASEGRVAGVLGYLAPGTGPSFFTTFADSGLKQAALQAFYRLPDSAKRFALQAIVIGLITGTTGYLLRKVGSATGMLATPTQNIPPVSAGIPIQKQALPIISPTAKPKPITQGVLQSISTTTKPMPIIPTQQKQTLPAASSTSIIKKPLTPSTRRSTTTRTRSSNKAPWYTQQRSRGR